MKYIQLYLTVSLFLFTQINAISQVPGSFSYQAVLRDASGNERANASLTLDIQILQGSPAGSAVFSETHAVTTNAFGLINLEIGSVNPAGFVAIDWAGGPYFIKIVVDGAEMGTSELLSVPYALYARETKNVDDEDANPTNELQTLSIDGAELSISDGNTVTLPTGEMDLDPDPTNELQDISLSGTSLSITEGSTVDLSVIQDGYEANTDEQELSISGHQLSIENGNTITLTDSVNDADANPQNEIQDISLTGTVLSISDGSMLDLSVIQDGVEDDDADPENEIQNLEEVLLKGTSAGNQNITNLASPVNDNDAATKIYVDELESRVSALEEMLIDAHLFTIIDGSGNHYNVIRIGNQVWMQENLKTSKYNHGTPIPLVTDNISWSNLTEPGYCWNDNDSVTYADPYGALYNWYAVETNKLCPIGWHVPTDAEWTALTDYLGGIYVAGGKLKETGITHWEDPNVGATNETGFTALPGAYRGTNGYFEGVGHHGYWWSATESSTTHAWDRNIFHAYNSMEFYSDNKKLGISVRCIRD